MILSVPLTMAVKLAALANDETYWLGVLLGPAPPPPAEAQSEEH